jgi:2-dehydropantoate 2-reductase
VWQRREMRFVIYGAGGVGGAIGGRLFQHGHDVVLIARGAHYDALRAHGLRLLVPEEELTLPVPVVDTPAALTWGDGDVVVLAMKGQDTASALDALIAVAPPSTPVVCAQNGVDNERQALRRFERVYGMCVLLPATFLEAGVVEANAVPVTGILDLGRYPAGTDEVAGEIAAALAASGFAAGAVPSVMRWKYRKLLSNLANSIEALCGPDARGGADAGDELVRAVRAEGAACLAAAGIDVATEEEDAQHRSAMTGIVPIAGRRRQGGSTWQSLRRGSTSVETDQLNGEIVLLGRLHGIPTPVNALLQARMREAVRERTPAGSVPVATLLEALAR